MRLHQTMIEMIVFEQMRVRVDGSTRTYWTERIGRMEVHDTEGLPNWREGRHIETDQYMHRKSAAASLPACMWANLRGRESAVQECARAQWIA